jgi:hypothetical protein
MQKYRTGSALVIVAGAITVLIILVVAFTVAMRHQRLRAWHATSYVQVKQLCNIGLNYALEDINTTMEGYCYPFWGNKKPAYTSEAMCSDGDSPCSNIINYTVLTSVVPASVWMDASQAVASCKWMNIRTGDDSATNGRIAYLVVNCSGFLDANVVGGGTSTFRTNISEIDLSGLNDISDTNTFFMDRFKHRRYETFDELCKLNSGVNLPVSNLFIYSYEGSDEQYFITTNKLGTPFSELRSRFCINRITEYNGYTNSGIDGTLYTSDSNFMGQYWMPLTNIFVEAGLSGAEATNVAWALVNYLDPDRLPVCDSPYPWQEPCACEDVPLINEIVLSEVALEVTNYFYRFTVELWFPFYPGKVIQDDNFTLQIGIFTNDITDIGENEIMNSATWLFTSNITNMEFGSSNEFLCVSTPPLSFPQHSRIGLPNPENTNLVNTFYFLARVLKDNIPVDEAMGYRKGDTTGRWRLKRFDTPSCFEVADPRLNSGTNFWVNTGTNNTLGRINSICDPWANNGQGLPVYHANRLMRNIGEIGYIYRSLSWQSVQLTDYDKGAALLDMLTVHLTNTPRHGLVHISTSHDEVIKTLLHNVYIGPLVTNSVLTNRCLTESEIDMLLSAMDRNGMNFRSVFGNMGVDSNFSEWKPDGLHKSGILKEDFIRQFVEFLTFRQNIFLIIVAAQTLAPASDAVTSEAKTMSLVYRDSYTGRMFIRWQVRLIEE